MRTVGREQYIRDPAKRSTACFASFCSHTSEGGEWEGGRGRGKGGGADAYIDVSAVERSCWILVFGEVRWNSASFHLHALWPIMYTGFLHLTKK